MSIVVLILSRICFRQVEPSAILSGTSPRVSQGVLLSLVLQLSSELAKDTGHKLQWIKEAALALNPDDPHLGKYMRQCLEQAYQNCHCLMGVTTIPSEQANLRLVIHVMNSLMSSCKWQPLMIFHKYRSRVTRSGFFTRSAREISRIQVFMQLLEVHYIFTSCADNTGRRSALST